MRPVPLLLGLVGLVIFVDLFPFFPLRPVVDILRSFLNSFDFAIKPPIALTILARIVALGPVGYLFGRSLGSQSLTRLSILAAMFILALAFGLELIQLPVAARHARFSDALMTVWCLSMGFALARFRHDPRQAAGPLALGVGAAVVVAISGFLLLIGPSTANWRCGMQLIAGNEVDGSWPWAGSMDGAAIYSGPMDDATVARLSALPFSAANEAARTSAGALWSYAAGARAPLTFGAPSGDAQGFVIPFERSKTLCQAIRRSGAFTVELRVKPAGSEQDKRSRILTFADSVDFRNLAIDQTGSAYNFRVRTLSTSEHGSRVSATTPPGIVSADHWQHLLAVYRKGHASLFVDGVLQAGPVAFRDERGPWLAAPLLMSGLALATAFAGFLVFAWRARGVKQ